MLRHYLLTAVKVLQRRKFFTFVNVFAVAVTLAVLTVVIALVENYVRPMGAESRSDHYLAIDAAEISTEDGSSSWSSSMGYRFLERHVLPLEEPDLIGFFAGHREGTVFVGERKLSPDVARTNGDYWEILDYRFVEGRPIDGEDVEQGRFVAVLNRSMRSELFGAEEAAGRSFTLDGQRFEVVGVVEDEPSSRTHAFSEIWVPFTTARSTSYRDEWMGPFTALLYVDDRSRLDAVRAELWASLDGFEHDDPERYQVASAPPNTKLERVARLMLDKEFSKESPVSGFLAVLGLAMFGFMLLPSINLVNLNVSRILERAPEIGIRKAFGASARTLVIQFLVENMVLSVLGGLVGFGLGVGLLSLVESSGLVPYADFRIDWRVFLGAFAAMTVFGIVSGVYPAFKMARYNPVRALRGGN